MMAVKQQARESMQGRKEFLVEVLMLTVLSHIRLNQDELTIIAGVYYRGCAGASARCYSNKGVDLAIFELIKHNMDKKRTTSLRLIKESIWLFGQIHLDCFKLAVRKLASAEVESTTAEEGDCFNPILQAI